MPSTPRALIALALLSLLAPLTTAAHDATRPLAVVTIAMTDAAAIATAFPIYMSTSLDALDAGPAAPTPPTPAPTVPPAVAVPIAAVVAAPIAVPVAAPIAPPVAPPVARPASAPASCPSDWLCYPRLGLAGPIVPYSDCEGKTDVGRSIREFTCVPESLYLMGHAYTKFGAIASWRAGDVVTARGQTFTITGAVTARSCEPPPLPLAALSLQTSLTPNACGAVLIVQGR